MKNLKDKEMYIQLRLRRVSPNAVTERVIWANYDKAIVGKQVEVEEDDGTWTAGWEVVDVYGSPLPVQQVRHNSHAHTKQRQASDI